jgi:hypothetical protein
MSKIILNIGLAGNGQTLDEHLVSESVAELVNGVGSFCALVQSHTEPTLVVEFVTAELDAAGVDVLTVASTICNQLDQDCVALYSTGVGAGFLIGPRASKWGPFNPNYFFLLDGRTLATQIADEVQAGVIH